MSVNRITVVETVTRESPSNPVPDVLTVRLCTPLALDEQTYTRVLKVTGDDWTPCGTGWVGVPGTLVIKNNGPGVVSVGALCPYPVPEEFPTEFATVPPGDVLRLTVPPGVRYAVRCVGVEDSATVVVWAFPK